MTFLGLAVPGASNLDSSEELVAIWRAAGGQEGAELSSEFTVFDTPVVSRVWIDGLIAGTPDDSTAPEAWRAWVEDRTPTSLDGGTDLGISEQD